MSLIPQVRWATWPNYLGVNETNFLFYLTGKAFMGRNPHIITCRKRNDAIHLKAFNSIYLIHYKLWSSEYKPNNIQKIIAWKNATHTSKTHKPLHAPTPTYCHFNAKKLNICAPESNKFPPNPLPINKIIWPAVKLIINRKPTVRGRIPILTNSINHT